MSWMIHFSGKDFGPISDETYGNLVKRLTDASEGVGGVHHVGYEFGLEDSPRDETFGFFWTPGAPIAFTRIR